MRGKRMLLVGLGTLGAQVLDLLVRLPGHHTFLVGGRNLDCLRQRSNLSLLTAVQLGYSPDVVESRAQELRDRYLAARQQVD